MHLIAGLTPDTLPTTHLPNRPENQPTSERAIPISIFSAEPSVARAFLRKWCGGDVGSGEGLL